ncbi:MAG: PD-(D/E)XK nuclease family protein [Candidatus Omnitrophica bacterium]|nr:PD-(D/E)XK nuclease family protein [Candidatus Omnitrophota bacterium]
MNKIICYSPRENFIGKLAAHIDAAYMKPGKDMRRLACVFEGKRPSFFLKKELSSRFPGTFIPPRVFSIDEFASYLLSKKRPVKPVLTMDACYMIYNIIKDRTPEILEKRGGFAEFLPWAREIAGFIDLIDAEGIPSEKLSGVEASASIGYDVPENINKVLRNIVLIRSEYHKRSEEKGVYPRGFRYSILAREIDKECFAEFDEIYFCAFYFMQKTLVDVAKFICSAGKGTFFFQADDESGGPVAEIAASLGVGVNFEKGTLPDAKKISLYSASDTHGQVAAARDILKKNLADPGSTVVVLPDAEAVIPLISELGSGFGDFNVSLGYPLKRSALAALFALIVKAQKTRRSGKYYTKDYISVISQPLAKNMLVESDERITRIVVHKIEEYLISNDSGGISGSIFIELADIVNEDKIYANAEETFGYMGITALPDDIRRVVEYLHETFFTTWENITTLAGFAGALEKFLERMASTSALGKYPLNVKTAERFWAIADEMKGASCGAETFRKEEIFRIFNNILESEMLKFSGSPLKGLQVLGILETRAVNFDNAVILDANEGKLPAESPDHPLIPNEITRSLGVDMAKREEKVQEYLFNRLIKFAKRVDIIYEEATGKERSRFLEKTLWALEKEKKIFETVKARKAGFRASISGKERSIPKGRRVAEFLMGHRYSASSINTYLNCPLQFYYRYALLLEEKDEISDVVEGSDIGTFIHELLEAAYKPFIGKRPEIDEGFREALFNDLSKKFKYVFSKKMRADSFILETVMRGKLEMFLKHESERDIEEILYLEEKFTPDLVLPSNTFKFQYTVDRVDKLGDGSILVLDYKTGLDAKKPVETKKLGGMVYDRRAIKNKIRSFQLPLYYLFEKEKYPGREMNAALYSLRKPGLKYLITPGKTDIALTMEICLRSLDAIMAEIIDPDVPFSADTDDNTSCRYCPFGGMCS